MKNDNSVFLSKKHSRFISSIQDETSFNTGHNLHYSIFTCSSFINNFNPCNILIDIEGKSKESKWLVNSKGDPFLILKLNETSIVKYITFGKFQDQTALKEFKIYCGFSSQDSIQVLHSYLSASDGYETVSLKETINNDSSILLPSNFIKIVPINPWSNNESSVSVWFVKVKGVSNRDVVQKAIQEYSRFNESKKRTKWVKLTRQLSIEGDNICVNLIIKFENENKLRLYNAIINGDFIEAEKVFDLININNCSINMIKQKSKWYVSYRQLDLISHRIGSEFKGLKNCISISETLQLKSLNNHLLFNDDNNNCDEKCNNIVYNYDADNNCFFAYDNYSDNCHSNNEQNDFLLYYHDNPCLNNINISQNAMDIDTNSMLNFQSEPAQDGFRKYTPCGRFNHSTVLDESNNIIYLFGGSNGQTDLNDFWLYDIKNSKWSELSSNTTNQNGPSSRSYHQMVFDNYLRTIFVFGGKCSEKNDCRLYSYSIDRNQWFSKPLTFVKKTKTKPKIMKLYITMVTNHQMVIDDLRHILYLYGGVGIFNGNKKQLEYLGLYKHDLNSDSMEWVNLFSDSEQNQYELRIQDRLEHSLMFNKEKNELIILGGKQLKKPHAHLSNIIIYEIDTGTIREVIHNFGLMPDTPELCVYYRCYYHSKEKTIYFIGSCIDNSLKRDFVSNYFWVFDMELKLFFKCEISFDAIDYNSITECFNENYGIQFDDNLKNEKDNKSNSSSIAPIKHFRHSFVYSAELNQGFVFGGAVDFFSKNNYLNDLWSFSLRHIKNELKAQLYKTNLEELIEDDQYEQALKVLNAKSHLFSKKENSNIINVIYRSLLPENQDKKSLIQDNERLFYSKSDARHKKRQFLYETLVKYSNTTVN